jgi:hypothetical protein
VQSFAEDAPHVEQVPRVYLRVAAGEAEVERVDEDHFLVLQPQEYYPFVFGPPGLVM